MAEGLLVVVSLAKFVVEVNAVCHCRIVAITQEIEGRVMTPLSLVEDFALSPR